ncbi:hypothetical protein BJ912DRAFT_635920 [Pholiota molesta]|nr:hypothetical protein BJ912DRAFT_635920 [Pholiota molesta]
MVPEWNIKACILEPGGFETGWVGAIISFDQHPAYKGNPADFRNLRSGLKTLGDPARGAQAIIRLSHEDALPLRVSLGSDSLAIVKAAAQNVLRVTEKYEHISRMTDKPDMDGVAYGEMIIKKLKETSNV